MSGPHKTHELRGSDASSFDVICVKCGRTDCDPGGWGELADPCPQGDNSPEKPWALKPKGEA